MIFEKEPLQKRGDFKIDMLLHSKNCWVVSAQLWVKHE